MKKCICSLLFCLSFPFYLAFCSSEVLPDKVSSNSLNHYQKVVYSQFGEDGIIEEIFHRLRISTGVFIEFGAANGKWLSNTRHLWEKGWRGLMIEAKERSFQQLQENYKDSDRILCLNYFVTPHPQKNKEKDLDHIIQEHLGGTEVDFLSIDIDGLDYTIFEALKARPKVICLETNLFWHPNLKVRIPDDIAAQNLNQPLSIVIEIARKKGYKPVCQTINLFLVREDLYEPFRATPSDPKTLWLDALYSIGKAHSIREFRKHNKHIQEYESQYLKEEERDI